jgi:hypothetical protein
VSSDDVSAGTRFVGVGGDGFIGFEVQVALDGKSEFAARDDASDSTRTDSSGIPAFSGAVSTRAPEDHFYLGVAVQIWFVLL